jgi:hypothetical protein
MTFQSSMNALSNDAKRWDDTATMLKTATTDVSAMTLRFQDFSFMGGDAHSEYEKIRAFMEQYLTDGHTETSQAAGSLHKTKDIYEGTDEAAKKSIESAWKWH